MLGLQGVFLSLLVLVGSASFGEVVNTVTLKVASAAQLRSYGDWVQLGFGVAGASDHYYLTCAQMATTEGNAVYEFHGGYGEALRLESSHLLRNNGEFLTGLKEKMQFDDCVQYLHEIGAAIDAGGDRVILFGKDDTSVAVDVK